MVVWHFLKKLEDLRKEGGEASVKRKRRMDNGKANRTTLIDERKRRDDLAFVSTPKVLSIVLARYKKE